MKKTEECDRFAGKNGRKSFYFNENNQERPF